MARVITPEAILSYPNLFSPRAANEGADPKYSCALVFPEGTDMEPIIKALADVAIEAFGAKGKALVKKVVAREKGEITDGVVTAQGLRWPIRTDWDAKGYPEGSSFVNVRSTRQPQIVSRVPDKDGRPTPITDPDAVYPGVIVKASLDPYSYDVSGNKGVTLGLGNVQVVRDGERLDNAVPATSEFEADEEAAANLDDLDGVDATDEDPLAGLS